MQWRSGMAGGNREELVGQLLFLSYRLEREFVGLGTSALLQILRLRLYARLLLLHASSSTVPLKGQVPLSSNSID